MKKTKKKKNPHAVALGAKGGDNTYEKHGSEHYRKAALKRWAGKKLLTPLAKQPLA